jgi:hypothetical protein
MRLNSPGIAIALMAATLLFPSFASGAPNLESPLKRLVSTLACGSEYRPARSVVRRQFSRRDADDVFVFLTTECDNQANFYLAIFQHLPSGYELLSHERIGGLPLSAYGIDFGYVRVEGDTFFLRAERGEDPKYGDLSAYPKVFYKWRLVDRKLVRNEEPYFSKQGKLHPIPALVQ